MHNNAYNGHNQHNKTTDTTNLCKNNNNKYHKSPSLNLHTTNSCSQNKKLLSIYSYSTNCPPYKQSSSTNYPIYEQFGSTNYQLNKQFSPINYSRYEQFGLTNYPPYEQFGSTNYQLNKQFSPINYSRYEQLNPTNYPRYEQFGLTNYPPYEQFGLTNYQLYENNCDQYYNIEPNTPQLINQSSQQYVVHNGLQCALKYAKQYARQQTNFMTQLQKKYVDSCQQTEPLEENICFYCKNQKAADKNINVVTDKGIPYVSPQYLINKLKTNYFQNDEFCYDNYNEYNDFNRMNNNENKHIKQSRTYFPLGKHHILPIQSRIPIYDNKANEYAKNCVTTAKYIQ